MRLLPYLVPILKLAGLWTAMIAGYTLLILSILYFALFLAPVVIWRM